MTDLDIPPCRVNHSKSKSLSSCIDYPTPNDILTYESSFAHVKKVYVKVTNNLKFPATQDLILYVNDQLLISINLVAEDIILDDIRPSAEDEALKRSASIWSGFVMIALVIGIVIGSVAQTFFLRGGHI